MTLHTTQRAKPSLFALAAMFAMSLTVLATPLAAEDKPLYERIGGYKAVAAAVDHLVDNIYVNQTLNKNPALKAVHDLNERAAFKLILATWVIENTGGPKVYIGRPMDQAHAHLSITAREFDVILHECKETFYQLGVPEKEMGELMAGLEAQRAKVVTAAKN
ncbi:MAG: group I truncated hemoglobin [Hyphomicrobium sp.]